MEENDNTKSKTHFPGQVYILYAKIPLQLDTFLAALKEACKQQQTQPITVNWIDEQAESCTLASQLELDEAIQLFKVSDEAALTVHVFSGTPASSGTFCIGHDKVVYKRVGKRWKKLYRVNGYRFQRKRLNRRVRCSCCKDCLWWSGCQGYRCTDFKFCLHKKCHRLVRKQFEDSRPSRVLESSSVPVPSPVQFNGTEALRTSKTASKDHVVENVEISSVAVSKDSVIPAIPKKKTVSLNDFKFLAVLGRGSFSKVFQAEHKRTKTIYAIKVIKKQLFNNGEDVDWVLTEKSVFETASNHSFFVNLYSCFQTESRLFFVMEFVPGGDLMFHLLQRGKLPEDHVRFYSAEITMALHFLHSHGIIYRDLKLNNVLIDAEGHIKLTDYGMCKENIGPNDLTSTFCGTPNYIAPEIIRNDDYGFSVDWWSLGVLMYEMMVGRSPFDASDMSINSNQDTEDYLFEIILDKQVQTPNFLSIEAAMVLRGFLNKDPKDRLGCKLDIDEALKEIKNAGFFSSIVDWELLEKRRMTPPFVPTFLNDRDLQRFDVTVTKECPRLTPDNSKHIAKIDQSDFEGFEYINPLFVSGDDDL